MPPLFALPHVTQLLQPGLERQIITGDPVFPLEIFELIAEQLASDPREKIISALNSLSVTSTYMLPIARTHIFNTLSINMRPDVSRRNNLAALMSRNSRLSDHVRRLDYVPPESGEEHEGVPLDDNSLAVFLQLPNLQVLNISMGTGKARQYECDGPSGIFGHQKLLETYLPLDRLTTVTIDAILELPLIPLLMAQALETISLHFCSIYIPKLPLVTNPHVECWILRDFHAFECHLGDSLSILQYCEKLQYVTISDCVFQQNTSRLHTLCSPPSEFPYLQRLTSDTMYEWATLGQEPHFPDLRELMLTAISSSASLNTTLPKVRSLRRLSLCCHENRFNHAQLQSYGQSLARCLINNIKTLTYFSFCSYIAENIIPLLTITSLMDVLELIPQRNIIDKLIISLTYAIYDATAMQQVHQQWERLDEMLFGDAPRFPCLKNVELYIRVTLGGTLRQRWKKKSPDDAKFWSMLTEPFIRDRRNINVTVELYNPMDFD